MISKRCPSLRDPSLRDAARSLQLLRSTASSGHRAARSLLPRSGTAQAQGKSLSFVEVRTVTLYDSLFVALSVTRPQLFPTAKSCLKTYWIKVIQLKKQVKLTTRIFFVKWIFPECQDLLTFLTFLEIISGYVASK
ncbi:MAG: hypothetical protein ACYTXA_04315 [Nostoc sp.]